MTDMEIYVVINIEDGKVLGLYTNTTELFESMVDLLVRLSNDDGDDARLVHFCKDLVEYDVDCLEDYGFTYQKMWTNNYIKVD